MVPTTDSASPLTREQTAALFSRTMGFVAATTACFAVGAFVGRHASYGWGWLWFLAAFGVLLGIKTATETSEAYAVALLFGFGGLLGLGAAPTIRYYADADARAVWQAGAATALFIAGAGVAGYATRVDLSVYRRYFSWALVALIGFGVVLIFVQIPNGELIYAVVGLAIFAALTSFDFQRLRRSTDIDTAPLLAASIFLDIINVFLLFLSLFGGGSGGRD